MEKLKFFDMKSRKTFETNSYDVKKAGKVNIAVTIAPSGVKSTRILGRVK